MPRSPLKRGSGLFEKREFEIATRTESQPARVHEGRMPSLYGAVGWLNSAPLDSRSLTGKVVLVDIWTYSCINSLRQLPYMKAWAERYRDLGLVVIGVHSPEFGFERERANVESAVRRSKISYPVAIDSDHLIWKAFDNEYWPADYFIDAKGEIRHHHFGEGEYDESERVIQALLTENKAARFDGDLTSVSGDGAEAPPSGDIRSSETYAGYSRAENFASPEPQSNDKGRSYTAPERPSLNRWGLGGSWNVHAESAELQTAPGKIVFAFHSRDLHMVLGPSETKGKQIRFKLKLDGAAPRDDGGVDSDPDGNGAVVEPRLYQLVRQKGIVKDRTFEIEFLDPGVRAYSFTFG